MNWHPYVLPVVIAIGLIAANFWIPDVDARDWSAILPAAAVTLLILGMFRWFGMPFVGLIIVLHPLLTVSADIGQLIVDARTVE